MTLKARQNGLFSPDFMPLARERIALFLDVPQAVQPFSYKCTPHLGHRALLSYSTSSVVT